MGIWLYGDRGYGDVGSDLLMFLYRLGIHDYEIPQFQFGSTFGNLLQIVNDITLGLFIFSGIPSAK